MNLYPHQRTALKLLTNGSILWGGVGSGKSRTAIAYYMENEAPRDIYIITTAKKRDSFDWVGEASAFAISTEEASTFAGQLTVDSWNNIKKYEQIHGAFFIFDEQRLVGSGAWTKSFYKIAAKNHWILLSATPGDTWLDYIPVFVANGFYKNRTEFLRNHVVYNSYTKYPKVERFINQGRLLRHREKILVHMPYKSHAERRMNNLSVSYDREMYDLVLKDRWNPYEEAPIVNVSELFYTIRRVVNSDPSRLDMVHRILETQDRLIIFYTFNYELDILRDLGEVIPIAEWNGHKHEPIPNTDRWVYLVQYASGSEGWNCTETNAICFYSLTYSFKMFKQAQGRIDRLDSPFDVMHYYVLRSNASIDRGIHAALQKKKNFNEKGFNLG